MRSVLPGRTISSSLLFIGLGVTIPGCFPAGGEATAVLAALATADRDSVGVTGNVVVSFTNTADMPAQWKLAWQGPDRAEPNVLTTVTDAGRTATITLSAPITRLGLGDLTSDAAGVLIAPNDSLSESVPVLEAGSDFHDGDIIAFTLSQHADGTYRVDVRVVPGG